MRRNKDKRITASSISIKQFLIIFATVLFTCSNYHLYFLSYLENRSDTQNTYSGIILIFILSLIGAFLISVFKKISFDRPIRTIADAAKQVAEGDFSVRIPPHRNDGKKDHIEVLIEDFNKMVEELTTIEILKTDFIANVSHEIKTPLAVIQSYAAAIQDDSITSAERHEYGKTIVEASKKLTELVTNILKLNKLESQEIVPASEPYALDEQLRECVLSYEELWDKKKGVLQNQKMDIETPFEKTSIKREKQMRVKRQSIKST